MSVLRNELQLTRETYAAARYPGDLAADVLPEPRAHAWRWAVAVSAVAAAIIVSLTLWPDSPDRGDVVTINAPIAPEPMPLTLEIPPMPALPSGVGLTLPGMPEMPSLDALLRSNSSNSTTQEAV